MQILWMSWSQVLEICWFIQRYTPGYLHVPHTTRQLGQRDTFTLLTTEKAQNSLPEALPPSCIPLQTAVQVLQQCGIIGWQHNVTNLSSASQKLIGTITVKRLYYFTWRLSGIKSSSLKWLDKISYLLKRKKKQHKTHDSLRDHNYTTILSNLGFCLTLLVDGHCPIQLLVLI